MPSNPFTAYGIPSSPTSGRGYKQRYDQQQEDYANSPAFNPSLSSPQQFAPVPGPSVRAKSAWPGIDPSYSSPMQLVDRGNYAPTLSPSQIQGHQSNAIAADQRASAARAANVPAFNAPNSVSPPIPFSDISPTPKTLPMTTGHPGGTITLGESARRAMWMETAKQDMTKYKELGEHYGFDAIADLARWHAQGTLDRPNQQPDSTPTSQALIPMNKQTGSGGVYKLPSGEIVGVDANGRRLPGSPQSFQNIPQPPAPTPTGVPMSPTLDTEYHTPPSSPTLITPGLQARRESYARTQDERAGQLRSDVDASQGRVQAREDAVNQRISGGVQNEAPSVQAARIRAEADAARQAELSKRQTGQGESRKGLQEDAQTFKSDEAAKTRNAKSGEADKDRQFKQQQAESQAAARAKISKAGIDAKNTDTILAHVDSIMKTQPEVPGANGKPRPATYDDALVMAMAHYEAMVQATQQGRTTQPSNGSSPEGTIITDGKGNRMVKRGGQWMKM